MVEDTFSPSSSSFTTAIASISHRLSMISDLTNYNPGINYESLNRLTDEVAILLRTWNVPEELQDIDPDDTVKSICKAYIELFREWKKQLYLYSSWISFDHILPDSLDEFTEDDKARLKEYLQKMERDLTGNFFTEV
jgi:hypothetical protein